jgi:glycosyltransferase involved in cell wall biosynthesis
VTPQTSLLVCGKFHYFNYVESLARKGHLRQFIFSHRLGSQKRFAGKFEAQNLWLKEYLYQAHYRLLGERGLPFIYHAAWDFAARRALKPCDLLHFLMHGNCVRTIQRAKKRGAFLLAEAVNSHPADYTRIIYEELDMLGISGRREPVNLAAMAEERRLADCVLVPSRFVQESYECHGTPASQIVKLPYCANLTDFQPDPSKKCKTFKVVCMAQVSARKGHYYLLQAWRQLGLKEAELHCYGYWDRDVIKALQRLNVPNVHFHGSVPKREVILALQSAHLAVLPTVEDGLAVVILEALAAGLPVVTTTHSGGSEVIENGKEGFVVPPRSIESLAQQILYFYQNREAAEMMGRAARAKVESGWGWENYANRLLKIYERLWRTHHSAH